ncbi:hypothetical protein FEM33_07100 [Dyadobacter flavalbus]|uniref:Uncharacterized protein n=1 Tax=Dyadobacter flavalbus TaxID=2579942 RepID=A0A5M8QVN6_9BACT|nr:hypothetical protein [Dyadobacter flavalbus]KAA6440365.1 hypothetical protein FEM33_07100 [Dyadobacter flavalbus]
MTAFVQRHGGADESVYLSSFQNFNVSALPGNGVLTSNLHLNFEADHSGKERKSAVSVAVNAEEKEDESVASRKYIAVSKGLHAALCTQTGRQLCHHISRSIFYFRHFTYSATYRLLYLKLKVFRI